jgi:hypothetical protein
MEQQTFGAKMKSILKKIMWGIIIILVLGVAYIYWGVFEEGVMAGKVIRVSQKGVLFKTFEGKINLGTFGALKGVNPIAESFDFSVEKDEEEVISQLQAVALSGENINLHFIKRYVAFPWRGDTKYFAVKVERLNGTPLPPAVPESKLPGQ